MSVAAFAQVQLQCRWEREGAMLMCNCIKKLACMMNKLALERCLPNTLTVLHSRPALNQVREVAHDHLDLSFKSN